MVHYEPIGLQELKELKEPTSLWWKHTPKGGYGYSYMVPCIFVKVNRTTVTIEARKINGTYKEVRVKPENLFRRYGNVDHSVPK